MSFVCGLLVHLFYISADFPLRYHNRTRRPDNAPDECIGGTYKRIVGYPALGFDWGDLLPSSKGSALTRSNVYFICYQICLASLWATVSVVVISQMKADSFEKYQIIKSFHKIFFPTYWIILIFLWNYKYVSFHSIDATKIESFVRNS